MNIQYRPNTKSSIQTPPPPHRDLVRISPSFNHHLKKLHAHKNKSLICVNSHRAKQRSLLHYCHRAQGSKAKSSHVFRQLPSSRSSAWTVEHRRWVTCRAEESRAGWSSECCCRGYSMSPAAVDLCSWLSSSQPSSVCSCSHQHLTYKKTGKRESKKPNTGNETHTVHLHLIFFITCMVAEGCTCSPTPLPHTHAQNDSPTLLPHSHTMTAPPFCHIHTQWQPHPSAIHTHTHTKWQPHPST